MAEKNEKEKAVNEQIRDFGQVELEHGEDRISMLTIIGEIEGHECLPAATKTTKYEHVLPKLAEVEENKNVEVATDQNDGHEFDEGIEPTPEETEAAEKQAEQEA